MNIAMETEVLVAGVVEPECAEARLLDAIVGECCTVLYDVRLFADYRMALSTEALELPGPAIEQFLDFLADSGLPIAPSRWPAASGTRVLRVAREGCADAVVSLQPLRYPEPLRQSFPILTAHDLLSRLAR